MSLPSVVSREEWLVARKELLAREKELTRARDALNADRRRLPMVRVDARYEFEGPDGVVSLGDLFDGSNQLIVQHVMFGPDWEQPCPGCTASLDEMTDALQKHMRSRDTRWVAVSRAPHKKIADAAAAHGWTHPWYSSFGSDFNYDFAVTIDPAVTPAVYNYRTAEEYEKAGGKISGELPGFSAFIRDGDAVYHTYSTYARGSELYAGGTYGFLDITAMGRQEDWEEPKGRAIKVHGAEPTFTD